MLVQKKKKKNLRVLTVQYNIDLEYMHRRTIFYRNTKEININLHLQSEKTQPNTFLFISNVRFIHFPF